MERRIDTREIDTQKRYSDSIQYHVGARPSFVPHVAVFQLAFDIPLLYDDLLVPRGLVFVDCEVTYGLYTCYNTGMVVPFEPRAGKPYP